MKKIKPTGDNWFATYPEEFKSTVCYHFMSAFLIRELTIQMVGLEVEIERNNERYDNRTTNK